MDEKELKALAINYLANLLRGENNSPEMAATITELYEVIKYYD